MPRLLCQCLRPKKRALKGKFLVYSLVEGDPVPTNEKPNVVSRRELLGASALLPALLAARPSDLLAAQYDLVIRGGRVYDASQKIDRVADVAIRDGKVAAIR